MQITQFTDYSLRTLMYLGKHRDRLCTVREIADYYSISQNHLVKVAHNLSRLEYIKSSKGKGGGICLIKSPKEINLRDLVCLLEPNLTLVECFNEKNNSCRISEDCGLKHIFYESLQAFLGSLGKYTLADTIKKPKLFS